MGEFVNIEIPNYYYWEGDPPELPQTETKTSYKIVGPDSTTITISSGFEIKYTTKGYKILGKRANSKLILTFAPSSTNTENGTTTVITNNSTAYKFKGNPAGVNKYEVNRGNVIIKESEQQRLMNATKKGIDSVDSAKNTYVKNTVAQSEFLKTDTLYSSSKTMDKMTRLLFLFLNDFVMIIVISFFVIGILLTLKADADSLYPCDLSKFPFVSNEYKHKIDVMQKDGGFCAGIIGGEIKKPEIKTEDKPVVKIYNDVMNGDTAYKFSSEFQENCKDTTNTSGAMSVLVYWMLYLRLHIFVWIQKTLNLMHGSLKLVSNVPVYVPFTILLVVFFFMVQTINNGVLNPYFKYTGNQYKDFDPSVNLDTNTKRDFLNLTVMLLISILALVVVVALPLFMIFSVTTIYANIKSLLSMIITSSSVQCMFLSFFAIICSINFVLKLLPEDLDPTKIKMAKNLSGLMRDVIDFIMNMFRLIKLPDLNTTKVFFFFVNIFTFLGSIFGVFLPFFMALASALYIAFKVLFSAAVLPWLVDNKWEMFTPALRVVTVILLFLLLVHVNDILGQYFLYIAIFITILFGLIMSKNMI
jgi:hypothetical protein